MAVHAPHLRDAVRGLFRRRAPDDIIDRPPSRRTDDRGWRGERPWPAGQELPKECFRHEGRAFSSRVLRREVLLVTAGIAAILMIALVLVSFMSSTLGVAAVILSAVFLTAYIVLLMIPVWLAAVADDVEDHRETPANEGEETERA